MNSRYILEHSGGGGGGGGRQRNTSSAPRTNDQFDNLRQHTNNRKSPPPKSPPTRNVPRVTTSHLAEHPYLQHASHSLPKETTTPNDIYDTMEPASRPDAKMRASTTHDRSSRARAVALPVAHPATDVDIYHQPGGGYQEPITTSRFATTDAPAYQEPITSRLATDYNRRTTHERSQGARSAPKQQKQASRSEHVRSNRTPQGSSQQQQQHPDIEFYPQPTTNRPAVPHTYRPLYSNAGFSRSSRELNRTSARPDDQRVSRSEHVRSSAAAAAPQNYTPGPLVQAYSSNSSRASRSRASRSRASRSRASSRGGSSHHRSSRSQGGSSRGARSSSSRNRKRPDANFYEQPGHGSSPVGDILFNPSFPPYDDTSLQTSGEHPYEERKAASVGIASSDSQQPLVDHVPFDSGSYSSDDETNMATSQGSPHYYPNELGRQYHQRSVSRGFGDRSEVSSITTDDATGRPTEPPREYHRASPRHDNKWRHHDNTNNRQHAAPLLDTNLFRVEEVTMEGSSTDVTGRCPSLDLEWLLKLSDKRRGDAARDRGSLLLNENGRPARRSVIETNHICEGLMKQGFTGGLARTLVRNTDRFSVRIWLVDNCGGMNASDGHLVVQSSKPPYRFENESCTRWEEVQSCVMWHAELSGLLEAPMAIRFLHDPGVTVGPQQLGIAASAGHDVQEEITRLRHLLRKSRPSGTTELNVHLRDVCESIVQMAPRLRQRQERVALVVVTDGLPHDAEGQEGTNVNQEFKRILRMLQGLPVWVVIRLSTDEKRVVDFYNDLDRHLVGAVQIDTGQARRDDDSAALATAGRSVNLDVLDDFYSEAQEVHQHNPWLNYALPLHLCRESGVSFPAFDSLDNRALSPAELADFLSLLFDRPCNHNPATDYRNFRNEVEDLVNAERGLFNPIKKKFLPWIDMKELDRRNGSPGKTESNCNCVIQ